MGEVARKAGRVDILLEKERFVARLLGGMSEIGEGDFMIEVEARGRDGDLRSVAWIVGVVEVHRSSSSTGALVWLVGSNIRSEGREVATGGKKCECDDSMGKGGSREGLGGEGRGNSGEGWGREGKVNDP